MNYLKNLLPGLCLLILCSVSCGQADKQAAKPVTHTVVISGMQFHPDTLYVNEGDTVRWINKGLVVHDVTAYPGKMWSSDSIATGDSWEKVIHIEQNYYCSIHITMKGKIKVK